MPPALTTPGIEQRERGRKGERKEGRKEGLYAGRKERRRPCMREGRTA
jgi:hypothetical protein